MKSNFMRRLIALVVIAVVAVLGVSVGTVATASVVPVGQQVTSDTPEGAPAVSDIKAESLGASANSLGASLVSFAVPSYFDSTYCNGWWRYAAGWGRGCFVDGVGVAQDTQSDGVCVEAKYRDMYGRWLRVSGSGDCVGGAGNVFTVPKDPRTGSSYYNVRLYNGYGNYRTLSP